MVHVCTLYTYTFRDKYLLSTALFYYMLGNISPSRRSSLKCIQLVTVVKSMDVSKYGIDKVLKPFMEDIQKLEHVS